MVNQSSQAFFTGIYSKTPEGTFTKKINVLFIMQDYLRIDFETKRAKQ
jgi:hypothetical protein